MNDDLIEKIACILLSEEDRDGDWTPGMEWAAKIIIDHKDSEHCGDCTKMAHTCLRCQSEEYRQKARAVLDFIFQSNEKAFKRASSAVDAHLMKRGLNSDELAKVAIDTYFKNLTNENK